MSILVKLNIRIRWPMEAIEGAQQWISAVVARNAKLVKTGALVALVAVYHLWIGE